MSPQVNEPSDSSVVAELRQQIAQLQHQLDAKTEALEAAQVTIRQLERSLIASETRRQAAEAKLDSILNSEIVAISHVSITADRQIETLFLSAGFETISGYTIQELQPNPDLWFSRIHPDDMEQVIIPSFEMIFAEETYALEYRFQRKDNSLCWISALCDSIWDEATGCWHLICISQDITDRKHLEQALRTSETRLSDILDNTIASIISLRMSDDRHIQYDYSSAGCELIFGYTAQEVLADNTIWLARVHPDDRLLAVEFWQQFRHETITKREYRFFHKDGTMRWITRSIASRRDDVENCWVFTIVDTDITDRKQVEIALSRLNQELERQVQERTVRLAEKNTEFEAIFQAFPDLLFRIAADGTYLDYKSQQTQNLYCPPEKFLGRRMQDILPSPVGLQLFAAMQNCLQHNTIGYLDYSLPINGKDEQFEARIIPFHPDQVLQIVRNVSLKKQIEEKLRHREELFRKLFEKAPIATILADPITGQIIHCNALLSEMTGYSPAELLTMSFADFTHPDDIEPDFENMQRLLAGDISTFQMEKRYITKQQTIIWVHLTACLIQDQVGNAIYGLGMLHDITRRKQTETELIDNRDLFQAMFEESADAIFLVDSDTLLIKNCNQRAVELFEVENQTELIGVYGGTLHCDTITPEQQSSLMVRTAEQGYAQMEIEYLSRKGHPFWGSLAVKIIQVGGQTMRLVRVTDISDRKQAEAKIRASLQEKEVLLKEVHHRVKNNMQVISSLLRMQARRSTDRQTISSLQEAQHRIQSITLLHEQLYQSPDFSQIDVNQYIHSLTNSLIQSYEANRGRIRVTIDTDTIKLNLTTAIPCSLIINELVSNALKHAFPDGQSGEISIILRHEACAPIQQSATGVIDAPMDLAVATLPPHPHLSNPYTYEQYVTNNGSPSHQGVLIIRDNGVGMPEHLCNKSSTSLGLQIVQSLVQQLHGTLVLDCHHGIGTSIQITFPL